MVERRHDNDIIMLDNDDIDKDAADPRPSLLEHIKKSWREMRAPHCGSILPYNYKWCCFVELGMVLHLAREM